MKPQDKLNEIISKMIEKIETGEAGSWIKPWKTGLPQNFSTKKTYKGFNVFSLWITAEEMGYKTNNWLTFNQVKAMGGNVKQGEQATPVFFFKPLEIKEEDEAGNETVKTIPMLKIYNVFNLDQTTLEINSDNVVIPEIEDFVTNTGANIKTAQKAYFSPFEDYIGMPDLHLFESEEHYYSTLLHELSHWTGHSSRLDRLNLSKNLKAYAYEELIAETTSALLNAFLGVDYSKMQHEAYLASWLEALKAEPKMLWKVCSQAQEAFDFLMNLQEQKKVA